MFKLYDRIFILLSVLLIGFAIGITFKMVYNYAAKKPNSWFKPPIVVNCIGEEIRRDTIERAINYWEDKGEVIYFYQYEKIDSICNSEEKFNGFIILKDSNDFDDATLARTKLYTSGPNILHAEILFKKDRYNYYLLLEHELGHAFGYKHKLSYGHIMHPIYDEMSDGFW